ncbi:hypothetical protein CCYN2B_10072 [Capnocytophaga cynodegmi]|uniref:Uncharacterized protein n=1 Tax=Capnocytophaga cynodegmi TaxID=28189 RepID=A0A0B7HSY8_9FLAO|nr:hypothetical protein CCYN2B_10072 [Capnocytophaga cynodegmi]CEN41027.1 hypothetical protein CCYN49044_430022 [Capnocytophaga cynodegmi]CEN41361.1 hypothetical protein CCYN74_620001 [Capnocytophaga cynodegmi]
MRSFLQKEEIIPNIKQNPRNEQNGNIYFDEELYKNWFKIEGSLRCLIVLKD